MSRIIVDLLHITHTCPGTPQTHIIETRRTVVAIQTAEPCRRPRTVRSGAATVTVDCHRVRPSTDQCPACRTHIVVRDEATLDAGPMAPSCPAAPVQHIAYPCRVCGEPVAANLADYGAHLICRRWPRWR